MSPSHPTEESHPPAAQSRTTLLRTNRLSVTTWLAQDLPDLERLHSDPLAMQHMTSGVQDREQTRDCLHRWQAEHSAQGWSKWRIEAVDGHFVGRAGFSRAHDTRHREVGYLLAPHYWRHGLAAELLSALASWHHRHPDPALDPDLLAYVFPENAASRRVLEKTGFEQIDSGLHDADQLVYKHCEGRTPDWRCRDCGTDTDAIDEYYMVTDLIWRQATHGMERHLCIGCLERRLGRTLHHDDFTDRPFNPTTHLRRPPRLAARLTRPFS